MAEPTTTSADEAPSWREAAVARSLDPARARAEKRVQRFLDAALELMNSADTKDFTVQQVVDRSGQSLRSFYQYFEGKYELLLALFEESISTTADELARAIDGIDDPLERLRTFFVAYYRRCTPPPKSGRKKSASPNPFVIAEFAQQLLTEHPKEASLAFGPLVELTVDLLDEAAAAGVIRNDLDTRRLAGVVLQAIMFNAFSAIISGSRVQDGDEALLDIVFNGLAPS